MMSKHADMLWHSLADAVGWKPEPGRLSHEDAQHFRIQELEEQLMRHRTPYIVFVDNGARIGLYIDWGLALVSHQTQDYEDLLDILDLDYEYWNVPFISNNPFPPTLSGVVKESVPVVPPC